MSARSRAARYLEAILEHQAGQRMSVRWRWCGEWTDGPTVEQVEAWAAGAASEVLPPQLAVLAGLAAGLAIIPEA